MNVVFVTWGRNVAGRNVLDSLCTNIGFHVQHWLSTSGLHRRYTNKGGDEINEGKALKIGTNIGRSNKISPSKEQTKGEL